MLWESQKEITTAILAKHDSMNIAVAGGPNEYDIEANAIIDRIYEVGMDKEDIAFVVKDTFRQKFTESCAEAVPADEWTATADDIWAALGDDITKRNQFLADAELAEPNDEDMIFGV